MDIKLVLELKNHNVFYVKTDVVNYYITIPKTPVATNIAIELKTKMDNYNPETNDALWVMENVRNTFTFVDEYNITLVLPILNDESVSILEKLDTERFEQVNGVIGSVINNAYLNLKNANMQVESQIIMVNNDRFNAFIGWFVSKYNGRVIRKKLLELIQYYNVNATTYRTVATPAISFVVGTYDNEINAPKIIKDEPSVVQNANLKPRYSSGFSSYWLLAVITLVVSLVIAVISFAAK